MASAAAIGALLSAAYVLTRRLWLAIGLAAGATAYSSVVGLAWTGQAPANDRDLPVAVAVACVAAAVMLAAAVLRGRVVPAARAWGLQTRLRAVGSAASGRGGDPRTERFSLWALLGVPLLMYWLYAYLNPWWALAVPVVYWSYARFGERRRLTELRGGVRGFGEFLPGLGAGALLVVMPAVVTTGNGPHLSSLTISWSITLAWYALCEEMIFRGMLLRGLNRGIGSAGALVLVSLLFGVAHDLYEPTPFLFHMVSAALFGVAFLYTGRLWLPIGLHLGMNLGIATCTWNGQSPWLSIALQVAALVVFVVLTTRRARLTPYRRSALGRLRALRPLARSSAVDT